MAEEQLTHPELQVVFSSKITSLVLQPLPVGEPPFTLHFDVSIGRIQRILDPQISKNLHSLSHPGVRASVKMTSERYVWPSMRVDVTLWARTCLEC
ncbi:hypothetical protein AVEN_166838-1 [Araneus ventricosus]|uniref:Integrase zinc-binding domain-containing protein n=1 Tax=Araneus ventricosus TaxID=182803 RepID=A0A4Y2HA85_ARAVE|nr:hypothetical protein AVEN_166838-1 [Araneus ventricosus]